MRRLADAHVAVFGVGGVGGHCVQALARAGVGHITVIDDDVVSVTNINRQAVAMDSTIGQAKVEVIAAQVRDINPGCEVTPLRMFYTPETAEAASGLWTSGNSRKNTAPHWLLRNMHPVRTPIRSRFH